MAVEANRDNYEAEVLQSESPVMVDFWGPQCRPCLALMPTVSKLEEKYGGRIKVAKVNVAENRMLCAKLRVMSVPAYLFYRDGVEVKRVTGEGTKESDLVAAIEETIT